MPAILKINPKRTFILLGLVLFFCLQVTSIFAATSDILFGKDYFQTTHQAIQEAKESIYVAIYIINVDLTPTNDPASILLEDLINAKKRGIYVKVIMDNVRFNVNYNAYNRLQKAGIDVCLDTSKAVLHGKGIVIDSKICILGSFNWSRASLSDNYEFAAYLIDRQQAKKLLDYISKIELSPLSPILPQQTSGLKLPVCLLAAPPKSILSKLFTSGSEKAFDLYLYLARKAQKQNSPTIKIDYTEFGQALGYTKDYYFNVYQPLRQLIKEYGLIQRKTWLDELNVNTIPSKAYITIPDAYWDDGFCNKLSFAAKYLYLISLVEAQNSDYNPSWFRNNVDLSRMYYISEHSVNDGILELEEENILEVYRHKPTEHGAFSDRLANNYRLNPLQSEEQFQQALEALSEKYDPDLTQQASELSAQLHESKDPEKIETYIELIKAYGFEKVRETNSKVASKRRETGFHDISQVILILKGDVTEK
jgi:HKD family nuclease